MTRLLACLAAATAVVLTASGCGASYDEKVTYLHTVADRGAATHQFLASQDAKITPDRCTSAYRGISDNDPPNDSIAGGSTPQWSQQIEMFFVDSCVSGKPKPVPGSTPVPAAPAPTTSR